MMATIPTTTLSSAFRPRLFRPHALSFAPVPRRRAPSSRVASSSSPSGGGAAGGSSSSSSSSSGGGGVEAVSGSGGSGRTNSGKSSSSSSSAASGNANSGGSGGGAAAEAEAWSRVQLLRARLREATAREDYSAAAKVRDALAAAVDALPLSQRHVLAALDTASSPSASSLDRASALLRAADHVRPYAYPQLAGFLHDADDEVAAAAERALGIAFRLPTDEIAAARMDVGDAALEAAAAAGAMGGSDRPPMRRSHISRAIAAYSSAVEASPLWAEARNALATALYLAGDLEGSLRACETVLDMNPFHWSCAAGSGMCFIALG